MKDSGALTTAQQLELRLFEIDQKLKTGTLGQATVLLIDKMKEEVDKSLRQGDEIWVVQTRHRLTTKLQVVNAVAQGYDLVVLPRDAADRSSWPDRVG